MSANMCGCGAETKPLYKYKMLQLLGEGRYGEVAKCCNRATQELVALKVLKKNKYVTYYFRKELESLGFIKELDPDTFNLIKFIEHFEFDGRQCLAFEMLDLSVYDQMEKQHEFSLSEIRPMAKQLLIALFGLKSIGVMHTDIKSDNIMLVDQEKKPFKIKLIDFGMAKLSDSVKLGQTMQPIAYRSPEVTLGLPLSESVDMWTLACCLLIWYLGGFRCSSMFDQLTKLVNLLGAPSDELLNQALYADKYFVQEDSKWRLKTLQEYVESSGETPKISNIEELQGTSLEEVIKDCYEFETCSEFIDREAFHELLKSMFEFDAHKRITPAEALLHPFITMENLPHGDGYTQEAHNMMLVAQTDHLPLQRENLKKAAECEVEKRVKALLARKPAAPELIPSPRAEESQSGVSSKLCDIKPVPRHVQVHPKPGVMVQAVQVNHKKQASLQKTKVGQTPSSLQTKVCRRAGLYNLNFGTMNAFYKNSVQMTESFSTVEHSWWNE